MRRECMRGGIRWVVTQAVILIDWYRRQGVEGGAGSEKDNLAQRRHH